MKKLAVLLPAYNESLTIERTIVAFHESLPEASIYVIDNNSTDGTGDLARATLSAKGISGDVIVERRQGKGNALRTAFSWVDADRFLLADADLTYPAHQSRRLLDALDAGADMAVGDRHSAGDYAAHIRRPLHGAGNALVSRLINLSFHSALTDPMSGFRAFTREFVKNYPILVSGFEIEVDMTMHALDKRYRIVELPIAYRDRPSGSDSKLNTVSDGARVLFTIAQILRYYRPLMFFGSVGIFVALLGILAGVPVISDWLTYRYIYHVPLAILATGLGVIALLMLTAGLVLDGIAHHQRLSYERDRLRARDRATGL